MEPSVSAFAPGQSYRSTPYARIPLSEARQMVADGFAKTVNRGRSIEFFALRALKLRDRSCGWGPRLMVLVGEGNYAAKVMLEWLGMYRMAA